VTAKTGYDPSCPLSRPHGHHWNGLGTRDERECHGEPPTTHEETQETP
jgi:hypothetical protein